MSTAPAAADTLPVAPPAKPKAKQAATEYLVLSKEAAYWTEQKKIAAVSATAAIRAYLAVDNPDPDGTYVAVPARSWKPVTVKTETQTKLTLT